MSCTRKVVIINVVVLALFAGSVSGLTAPYLISATALSDSSVALTWRNNDVATQGYILQRKDSNETSFRFIDSVKSATQLTYTDTKSLLPATLYAYLVIAYNATSVSIASDTQQATTPARAEVFKKPSIIQIYWNFDTSKSVQIMIYDSSNCEIGYRIYRDMGFSSTFRQIAQITSADPVSMGPIVWYDTAITANTWYNYKVAVYKNNDSIFSNPCSTYTFRGTNPGQAVKFTKLSDFPVNASGSGWSAKAGDSIILKENLSPSGKYTVINVKDPANPKFDGYADSVSLLSYPLQTLIPIFMNFGVSNGYASTQVINYKDRMLVLKDSSLHMYQIKDSKLVSIDSLRIIKPGDVIESVLLLNDTLLGIQYDSLLSGMIEYSYFYPVYLSSSGFSSLAKWYFGESWNSGLDRSYILPSIHGYYDNKIYISMAKSTTGSYQYYDMVAYDMSGIRTVVIPGNLPYANSYNTGYHITPTEYLCTNSFGFGYLPFRPSTSLPINLFVSDVRNPHSHQFDSLNNAVYYDNAHRQNQLKNILLDTLSHHVFLIFTNMLTILDYQQPAVGAVHYSSGTQSLSDRIVVHNKPASSIVTIILPSSAHPSDLYFYDLSGRVIDKMLNITSNAVVWQPKTRSMGCYIVSIINGKKKYSARFLMK